MEIQDPVIWVIIQPLKKVQVAHQRKQQEQTFCRHDCGWHHLDPLEAAGLQYPSRTLTLCFSFSNKSLSVIAAAMLASGFYLHLSPPEFKQCRKTVSRFELFPTSAVPKNLHLKDFTANPMK